MQAKTKWVVINTAASVTQTLPEKAVEVKNIIGLAGAATSIAATGYTIQTAAPASATEVQFTGTPNSASDTLTFDAALTANGVLLAEIVPVGDLVASV